MIFLSSTGDGDALHADIGISIIRIRIISSIISFVSIGIHIIEERFAIPPPPQILAHVCGEEYSSVCFVC